MVDELVSINEALAAIAAEQPQKVPGRTTLNLALNRGQIEGAEKKWGRWVMPLEAVLVWNEGRPGHGGRPLLSQAQEQLGLAAAFDKIDSLASDR